MRALLVVAVAAGLASCAAQQITWYRADGQPTAGQQFSIDESICQGEMAKADSASVAPGPRRMQADEAVYRGCMAQRGYVEHR